MEFHDENDIDSDEYENLTPPEVVEKAAKVCENLLPSMSKERYEHAYNQFMDWRLKNKVNSFSEKILVAYFGDLSAKYKSSTLWSIYSMLRGTLIAKHDVNIAAYYKLKALLKKESVNYVAKKANVLTNDDIKTFIETAPNELYLLTKTALIFGVCGCMRKGELYNVKLADVKDVNSALIVDVPCTKTKKPRKFVITDNFYSICKEYINLRPLGMTDENQKFFINYQKGKCTRQDVGINKFGKLVQDIAKFLKLPHPEKYTGHTYRRASATIVADIHNCGCSIHFCHQTAAIGKYSKYIK
jgi:integrase